MIYPEPFAGVGLALFGQEVHRNPHGDVVGRGGVLEKRFLALWPDRQHSLLSDTPGDDPRDWMKEGAWLHRFCQEMKTLLLAELDTRLEPVQGLLMALESAHNDPQGPQ